MGTCNCCFLMRTNSFSNRNRVRDNNGMRGNNQEGHQDKMNQTHYGFRNRKIGSNSIYSKQRQSNYQERQDDYRLFSYFKWMKQCDSIVKQFLISTNKQQQQEDQTGKSHTNKQQLNILLQRLSQYLQHLETFLTPQFISTVRKLLSPSTSISNSHYQQLLRQSIVEQQQQSEKSIKLLVRRLLKDVFTVIYIQRKINYPNDQLTQITRKYLNQIDSPANNKQHSLNSNNSNLNNHIILLRSLDYLQTQQNTNSHDNRLWFLLKITVCLILNNNLLSKVTHNNNFNITQLTIKLVPSAYNKTLKKQKYELHIATFPIVSKNNNNRNKNSKLQELNLQFVIAPGMMIVFQTHPMQYICSLCVDQFLGKLYVFEQQFVFVKKQVISQEGNKENSKSALKQNLLVSQSSQSKDKKHNQLLYSQYPPRLSLTLQTIPMGVIEYFQRLKLTTKSMEKNIQAISTNNPLPLDMRSSFASNTSYQQSFRFSSSATNKTQSQCGC